MHLLEGFFVLAGEFGIVFYHSFDVFADLDGVWLFSFGGTVAMRPAGDQPDIMGFGVWLYHTIKAEMNLLMLSYAILTPQLVSS